MPKNRIWMPLLLIVFLLAACTTPNSTTPADATLPAAGTATIPAAATAASPAAEVTATEAPAASAAPTSAASPTAAAEIPQTAGGLRFVIVPEQSEARYRIREQLVNLDLPNDAVGTTKDVSGAIVLNADGSIDTAQSQLTVNMASITSDRSNRDNFVRRNVLRTDQYPTAVFTPTLVSGLPAPLPESGEVNFQVSGDLTLLDVTRPVTWSVAGVIDGDQAVGLATTSFTFETFNLTKPSVPVVLSVDDEIKLEVDVTLRREGNQTGSSGEPIPATGAASASTAPECASPAALTPPMTEGPYYSSGAPENGSLYQEGMSGTKLTLTGYVLTADCQPVPNARVDFWQADAQGVYDNNGFNLRGYQLTDASGRYKLVTVIPGEYPGRTEHLHVKVQAPGGPELTTQLFFPDAAQNQTDRIFDSSLVVNNFVDSGGSATATYNFIVAN